MSQVKVSGNASGTGVLTLTSPNTNSNYTLTLPANTGTLVTNATAGTVLQVVNGYNSGRVLTNNTSYTSLATSPSITPSSSTSKILVMCNTSIFRNGANGNVYFATYRNGSTSLIGSGSVENAGWWNDYSSYTFGQWAFIQLDSPATTSATNYQIMGKADGPTVYAGISGRGNDTDHQNGVTWTLLEIAA